MKIKKDIIDKIIAHAKSGAPIEVCGYLAGQNGVISRHYELTNIDDSEEHSGRRPEYRLLGEELLLTIWAKPSPHEEKE